VAFMEANAPEMLLLGVQLSPKRSRMACGLWLWLCLLLENPASSEVQQ
jgi:hypothetical protein